MLEQNRLTNLRGFAAIAVAHEMATQFPASVSVGQWAAESGWGSKLTGKFNCFGLTRAWSVGPSSMCPTTEFVTSDALRRFAADERITATDMNGGKLPATWIGSRWVRMRRWFRDYASLAECLADKTRVISSRSGRYVPAWTAYLATNDAETLILGVAAADYATGPGYADLVTRIMRQRDVREAIAAARL